MAGETLSRFVRIVSSKKVDEKFITAQHIKPESELHQAMGELFVLIEINRPWTAISQVGLKIITTLQKNYYQGKSSSDLVNFEQAVTAVNDMLLQLTEQGETDWIGRLHAVLGVLVNKELHITSTGAGQSYLFREGKVSHITESTIDTEPHPIKTFGSIVSGTLLENDMVLMANPELFTITTVKDLSLIIDNSTPYQAANQIATFFKRARKPGGALLLELITKSQITDEPSVVYIDQLVTIQSKLQLYLGKIILPFLQTLGLKIATKSQAGLQKTKSQYLPSASKGIGNLTSKTNNVLKQGLAKARPIISKKAQTFSEKLDSTLTGIKSDQSKEKESNYITDEAESIIGRSIYTIHDYQVEHAAIEESKLTKGLRSVRKIRLPIQFLAHIFEPQKRPLLLLIVGGLLTISLITSIAVRRHSQALQKITKEQTSTLQDAKEALNNGKQALIVNDKSNAQIKFGIAIEKSESLLQSALSDDANKVLTEAQTEYDALTGTKRFTELESVSQADNAHFITLLNSKGYIISQTGEIYETGLSAGSTATKVATIPESTVNSVVATANNSLFVLTTEHKVFVYEPTTKKVSELTTKDNTPFPDASDIELFGNTFYLLDTANNQIWKYGFSNDIVEAGSKYIARSVDLSSTIDLTIDGSVYALNKDGSAFKFSRGVKQDFKFGSIPEPFSTIKTPLKIIANEDTTSIFVLDKERHRLLEFDKNGQFTHQYVMPSSFTDIKDVYLQSKGRRAFVVNSSNVYELPL